MALPTTLYNYYQGLGQALPSLQQRGQLYQQYGLGSATGYGGSAEQNTSLLNSLLQQGQQSTAPNFQLATGGSAYVPPTGVYAKPTATATPTTTANPNTKYLAQASSTFNQQPVEDRYQGATVAGSKEVRRVENTPTGQRIVYADNTYKDVPTGTAEAQQAQQAPQAAPTDPLREKLTAYLERLLTLQGQVQTNGANATVMADLDKKIIDTNRTLQELTPEKFSTTEPGLRNVGINEDALNRRTIQAQEPITRQLSNLLISRSSMGQIQAAEREARQTEFQNVSQGLNIYGALRELTQPKTLGTQFDEATGSWNQLIQSPSGGLTTRTTSLPEVGQGLNAYEYKQVVDLAKANPGAGIKVGQPATTESYQNALAKVSKIQKEEKELDIKIKRAQLAKTLSEIGGGADKPLSGDTAKIKSIVDTMIPEIEKIKEAYNKGYRSSVLGILTGKNRELVKLVENIADKVGRIRSGGSVNPAESDRFKRQLVSWADWAVGSKGEAIAALDRLIDEAQGVTAGG